VTRPNGTDAAPFVKAATRDIKAYMKSLGGRYIPIGYSAADIATIRPMFQNYLVCGPSDETIDFFAVNIYEWVSNNPSIRKLITYSVEHHHTKPQDTQTA
jgi:1,3-beta-glucanosyltransferase GAS1